MSIHRNEIVAIADAQHGQPFQVLGPHQDEHGACIRAYHPMAVACWIVGIDDGKLLAEAKLIEPRGVFEAALTSIPSAYRLRYRNEKGDEWEEEDPYRFASQLSEFDLHLLREPMGWSSPRDEETRGQWLMGDFRAWGRAWGRL